MSPARFPGALWIGRGVGCPCPARLAQLLPAEPAFPKGNLGSGLWGMDQGQHRSEIHLMEQEKKGDGFLASPEHILSSSSGMGSLQRDQTFTWHGWEQPNAALGSAQSAGQLPG